MCQHKAEYQDLINEIARCSKCRLHKLRKNAVPGEGRLDAQLMLIGEAPGEKEDETGRPFVGQAGQLLNKIMSEVGIERSETYITNVVKCRPPNNRDPLDDEIENCMPYLVRQIEIVRPKVIVCLGRHSARAVLRAAGVRESYVNYISKIRGKVFRGVIEGCELTIIPTYHPAAALYNPSLRKYITDDLRKAMMIVKNLQCAKSRRSILDFFG